MAGPREIQLHIINHAEIDFVFQSKTMQDGHLLLEIYRRDQVLPQGGVVVPRYAGEPQGMGVLQYDENAIKKSRAE